MKRQRISDSRSVEYISDKRLRIEVQPAQTNGVEKAKRFLDVHLHCIVSNLKGIRKISTLPPLEKFLRTPMTLFILIVSTGVNGRDFRAESCWWINMRTVAPFYPKCAIHKPWKVRGDQFSSATPTKT